ncbi:Membrane-bound lytic murein transglycosylase B precursor [Pigmentiphaga humi]|uniref:Membrane-bound lytic murein transglycosylase B n=1 Tax=Pigmentiphaga humi TaxID=2478468 RepID=A0A3P4B039_9BURK|nr:lytic murein transglycosylase [Pigmentiphaga humi]VCU69663.1 Membrane-bound lytic murein transglycosylase B precursor [Pigmentiphaga humi]
MHVFRKSVPLSLLAGAAALMAASAAHAGEATLDTAACLARLRPGAPANGVQLAEFDTYTQGAALLPSTVASAQAQPEGKETWWDYIAKTVDDERVAAGRELMAGQQQALAEIAARYEVDGEVMVAIFGIETNYGRQLGKTRVLDAWLTRACTENKPLWIKNAYASIRLLRDGAVDPGTFVGSWSGAFGMTQFIPTSFYELAADGDGDGRIDLYGSLPDALASTASHLRKRRARWTRGTLPVVEVQVPAALAASLPPLDEYAGSERRTLADWEARGVKRAGSGAPLAGTGSPGMPAYLFAPTGARGPVFLATGNFDAILSYNSSRKYALAVSLLIDRLRGEPGLATPWPTDDPGLSRAEVRELQALLLARGYDIGTPDGIPGGKTRAAVASEQQRAGLATDGRVGRRMLELLRQDPVPRHDAGQGG